MEALFLKILNMSINASWLVLAVLVLRLLLKKAPKWVSVLMWGMVGLRLLCPFTLESALSLIPSRETVPPAILYDELPAIHSGIPAINAVVNPAISQNLTPAPGVSVNPVQILAYVAAALWIAGMMAMGLYTLISYWRIHRKVREAAPLGKGVWLCDHIASPFILGLFRPRIYIPSSMDEKDISYVLAHERAHLRRKDHWWKPMGFLLLAVHWFNPLLWLGYILLCRDIELACDEKVIQELGQESKKPYAEALINCSVSRKSIAACPLAFGEVGVKGRIKSVLHYKKPGFWILLAAVTACIVLAVCFLTNPRETRDDAFKVFIDCQIAERNQSKDSEGRACCVDWKVLGTRKRGGQTTIYALVLYQEYTLEGGKLAVQSGSHIPTAITVKKENGTYKLVEYWEPRDGTYYPTDIREKFPWYLSELAINCHWFVDRQEENCENMAWEYFASQEPAESIQPAEDVQPTESIQPPETAILIDDPRIYSHKIFDIDGDGVQEQCFLMLGHSSGVFSFVLAAYENGTPEYHNMYTTSLCTPRFTEDGPTRIQGVPNPNDADQTPRYFDISMDGENICLSENGKALEFWAEQGLDTIFAKQDISYIQPALQQGDTGDGDITVESYFDTKVFDIDGDGVEEECLIFPGPTSGIFTYVLMAFENGSPEYFNVYWVRHCLVSFTEDEPIRLKGTPHPNDEDQTVHYYDISIDEGNICLSENGEALTYYEEQGLNSPLAQHYIFQSLPKMLRDPDPAILDWTTFDIDADGRQEDCYLVTEDANVGMIFYLLAFEGEDLDHYDTFALNQCSISFIENEDGTVFVQGIPLGGGDAAYAYEIGMKDGYVVLWDGDTMIPNNGGDDKDSPYVRMLASMVKNPTAPRYDACGLTVDLSFQSSTEFDLVFHHDSKWAFYKGTLTTTPAYAIWGYTEDGSVIPLEKYIRDHLGLEYEEPELAWDDVVYTIQPDKGLTLHFDLMDTYGRLPSGTYWLNKPVTFTDTSGKVSYLQYQMTFVVP